MADVAEWLAGHLTDTAGDTAMVQRLRLLVIAGLYQEARSLFDTWYPQFENVADFQVCHRLAEAVAPDDLMAFDKAGLAAAGLLECRWRAQRRLRMVNGLHEYFEQTRHYVARRSVEGILEAAVHGVERPPRTRPQNIAFAPPQLIQLHGPGGMGKSTQLAWLVARYGVQHDPPVISAVCDVQTMAPERLLSTPHLLLAQVGERFLHQARAQGVNSCPRLEQFVTDHAAHRSALDRETAEGRETAEHARTSGQSAMTEAFADALNEVSGKDGPPLLLCLDTTDDLLREPVEDLAPLFRMLSQLLDGVQKLRVVLSGRADLTDTDVFREAFRNVSWRSLKLMPFTVSESENYLALRRLPPSQARNIVKASEEDFEGSPAFTPLVLALLADTPEDLPGIGDSLYLFVLDRVLWQLEPRERLALEFCAVARHPTFAYFKDVLVPLLGEAPSGETPEQLWNELIKRARQWAWIAADETRLVVHVNVRRELRRRVRDEEESTWRELHRKGADRCRALAREAASEDDRAGWVAEQVYHQLHAANQHTLDDAAKTWRSCVAGAWLRGAFVTVIGLADRLLSADLENTDAGHEGLGEPDPRVMTRQLWYDIALERAYGELQAVLYGGTTGWQDLERHLRLAERRSEMAAEEEPPVVRDVRREAIITAAFMIRDGQHLGLTPVREAQTRLRDLIEEYEHAAGSREDLRTVWQADCHLLVAACRVRTGQAEERPDLPHARADRHFIATFNAVGPDDTARAELVARYAMGEWTLADRPDLVLAWQRRYEELSGGGSTSAALTGAEAALRSGRPMADWPGSLAGPHGLRARVLSARSDLLLGRPAEAAHRLFVDALPATSGQLEPGSAFDVLMVLADAHARMLELDSAENYAERAMRRAPGNEERLAVMAFRAATALAVAGDLGLAERWITRAAPLREESRGAAGTALHGAGCVLAHRWGRADEAAEILNRWGNELRARRADPGHIGRPPAPAEWLAHALHGLVCGPKEDVKGYASMLDAALHSVPDPGRQMMLLAAETRLYGPVADAPLLTERSRIGFFERLLARHRDSGNSGRDRPGQAEGLRALWTAELTARLFGADSRAGQQMASATRTLGSGHGEVHATWLRVHRLLPPEARPDRPPRVEWTDFQLATLRGADRLARTHGDTSRWRPGRSAARAEDVREAAGLLGPVAGPNATPPTTWHLIAARRGADVGMPPDGLAERLTAPRWEPCRLANLQAALRRIGRLGTPAGTPDAAWTAFVREGDEPPADRLRQAVHDVAGPRVLTRVDVDVNGVGTGLARPPASPTSERRSGSPDGLAVWRVTEDFLINADERRQLDGDAPVDVLVLHGEMRPIDQSAALRLPGSARSIRPRDVHNAVRGLCEERGRTAPLVVLNALAQAISDGDDVYLRDLFAFQLHLLGSVPSIVVCGPAGRQADGTLVQAVPDDAVGFGRTAQDVADHLRRYLVAQSPEAPPVRLLSHVPPDEMFGLGVL
ncbi:hypothetical protein [Streptomyces sp. WAC 04229]|uniref:hypothetical protein n=1 Tax=Streptomyces sp. WAC 04229 TaxID=2203206 RepID=UPI003D726CF5